MERYLCWYFINNKLSTITIKKGLYTNTYVVYLQSGTIWATFDTAKEAIDFVTSMYGNYNGFEIIQLY
jgi:hypothetical protein